MKWYDDPILILWLLYPLIIFGIIMGIAGISELLK